MALVLIILAVIFLAMVVAAKLWIRSPHVSVFGAGENRDGEKGDVEKHCATKSTVPPVITPAMQQKRDSKHVVVDTLNLLYAFRVADLRKDASEKGEDAATVKKRLLKLRSTPITTDDIVRTIDRMTPVLKPLFPGQIMFVTKDRESAAADKVTRAKYQLAATRNGVYIYSVERYFDERDRHGVVKGLSKTHAAVGRDDFFMSLLAHRHRCRVITADALRDFGSFRHEVAPFVVHEFAYWRDDPVRDSIRPDSPAYTSIRKPMTILPSSLFPILAPAE